MLKRATKIIVFLLLILSSAIFLKFIFLGKKLDIATITPYLTKDKLVHDSLSLTYLGCAGFIIENKEKSILCDPFISNPNIFNFSKKFDSWSERISPEKLKNIDMVAISHGHYDHCYDITDLCNYLPSQAQIIADASVHNQLNVIYKAATFRKTALHYTDKQQWIYENDSAFRIFALKSVHSPHIGKIEFFKGHYDTPLAKIPTKPWQWKKGEAYSYLIDILENQRVKYRIVLVNGNLTNDAMQTLKTLSNERKSDIQLQIFWKEKLNIDNLLEVYNITQPKEIILHHWNNFFVSFDKPLQYMRDAHLPEVLKRLNEQEIPTSMMLPFTEVKL
ncbi:MAG TPA: MBL fold metallo-hydrolase [Chitinophagales bacterium]|nr:MBL fold metallo-hydrolase [Chitinophagales bacterium]